jgi:IS30 family transposase
MKNVTKDTFESIKQLQELNLSNRRIAKITNFSLATVDRVKRQETWADYIKYKQEYNVYRQHQNAMKKATSEKTYTWQPQVLTNTEIDLPTDKKVDRVADALERIATALEKANEKKGWRL